MFIFNRDYFWCMNLIGGALMLGGWNAECVHAQQPPNVIVIFTDDQGYNDLGCFGSETLQTPHIDRMAREGRKYTEFYVPTAICTPSRAALMTGCYPKRVGLSKGVLVPHSKHGLHPDEYTIADHLKANGYATACVGKWHLGHHRPTLPISQGFDSYFGIPYSNDMTHPANQGRPKLTSDALWRDQSSTLTRWKAPLMRDDQIVELPVDQRTITRRYTDEAIEFIAGHQHDPFFLYLPHSMPHTPLYVPEDVYDPEPRNAYKCVVEHLDAEVGRLMNAVRELGIAENTIVIYTSDNGPWLKYKNHAGSAAPLRDGKMSTFEGGHRVPCVMWAPGRIPAGTSTAALASTLDLLPTIAKLIHRDLPDREIDGLDITSTFTSDQSPRTEMLFYSRYGHVEGIRRGDRKYLEVQPRRKNKVQAGRDSDSRPKSEKYLFDLSRDIGEQTNLIDRQPEQAQALATRMRTLDQQISQGARPAWRTK